MGSLEDHKDLTVQSLGYSAYLYILFYASSCKK